MGNNINNLISSILEEDGGKDPKKYNVLFTPRRVDQRMKSRLEQAKEILQQEEVEGDIDLSGLLITDLGNLRSVYGDLNLSRTSIKDLGNLTYVSGTLDLSYTRLETLGDNFNEFEGHTLLLDGSYIKDLGSLTVVQGTLSVSNTKITDLTPLFSVGGNLYADNCPELSSIGDLTYVDGDLYLSGTKVSSLDGLETVGANLVITDTNITSLPEGLDVGNYIFVSKDFDVDSVDEYLRNKISFHQDE